MQDTDRNKTCCFIGHRKIKESEELKNKMLETIEHLIKEKEVYIFLFGSKSKFDDFAHARKFFKRIAVCINQRRGLADTEFIAQLRVLLRQNFAVCDAVFF